MLTGYQCDGQVPCARCAALNSVVCYYNVPTHVSKEFMKAEIKELQTYRQLAEHILGLLASGEQSESDFILRQLRSGKDLKDVSESLERQACLMRSDNQIPCALNNKTFERESSGASTSSSTRDVQHSPNHLGRGNSIKQERRGEQSIPHAELWTTVTTDCATIEHLMALYFCWEYPIFASFSRPHFLADFRAGQRRYCSSALVNAILAVGYQFSGKPIETKHAELSAISDRHFSREAERLLAVDQGTPSLTTIQALGIMSILEASQGRHKQSIFYCGLSIRMAVEMGLHLDINTAQLLDTEREVRRATIWGAFSLDL
jgi:hypothetical protein